MFSILNKIMTTTHKSLQSFVLPFAFGAAVIRVIIDFIAKLGFENILVYRFSFLLCLVLEVVFIILITKKYKTENNNLLTIEDGLKIGLIIMLVIGSLYSIGSYIHDTYINPEYQKLVFEVSQKNSDSPQEYQFSDNPIGIFISIIRFILLGFIISLVTSNFLKSNNQ